MTNTTAAVAPSTCTMGVEWEAGTGYRHRFSCPESEVDQHLASLKAGDPDGGLSDLWCNTHPEQDCAS